MNRRKIVGVLAALAATTGLWWATGFSRQGGVGASLLGLAVVVAWLGVQPPNEENPRNKRGKK
jgi:hypothetical protein